MDKYIYINTVDFLGSYGTISYGEGKMGLEYFRKFSKDRVKMSNESLITGVSFELNSSHMNCH